MLNGATLKTEAQTEIDKLEKELLNMVASSDGYGFICG
jgi:hypothetical protein